MSQVFGAGYNRVRIDAVNVHAFFLTRGLDKGTTINELEEFRAYTTFPEYKADRKNDTTYMGRFAFPMLMDFWGFQRVLTILARGFLFESGSDGYDRIDYARTALLAWCSVSTGRKQAQKKAPDQDDPGNQTNYAIYHREFPNLVDEAGDGWLVRHVENIIRFVEAHPNKVRKEAVENVATLKKGFRSFWTGKVDHLQAAPFSENTKGKWGLRIEDVMADALILGPLKDKDYDLPESITRRLTALTPKGVPAEVAVFLYKYYVANKTDDNDYVILPQQNVNAFFGTTAFSQKWIFALTGTILERITGDGVCKFRICPALLYDI